METQDTLRELLAAIILVSVKTLQDIMSCYGTMEQFRASEGTLNTLNFKEKKDTKPISGKAFLTPTARNTLT